MYSKTRNTLTALIAASLFLASGWIIGRPIDTARDVQLIDARDQPVNAHPNGVGQAQVREHRLLRLSLAMPYYSFSLTNVARRAD